MVFSRLQRFADMVKYLEEHNLEMNPEWTSEEEIKEAKFIIDSLKNKKENNKNKFANI